MPLRCLIFGHRWHNDQDTDVRHIIYDEPCTRTACVIVRNPAPETPELGPAAADRLADLIHARRFDRRGHADTFYAGMAYAERLIRGDN